MGGVVVDKLLFGFSICGSVPEIFAIKVVWIKICDDIPISSELIDVHTLNFKPNFTFSRLKFFWGGPPFKLGYALGSLVQSLACV